MHPDVQRVKLVAVGDGGVGKTCLFTVFATNKFPIVFVPTVFDAWASHIELDGQVCALHLFDTAGQVEYDWIRPLNYPHTNVLLICFSLENYASFKNVEDRWYPEVNRYCPDVPIVLVGTKLDLREDKEHCERTESSIVSSEEGFRMQTKNPNVVKYLECSALTQYGVKEVFESAIRTVLLQYNKQSEQRTDSTDKCCTIV